ncbi:hypothetical protein VaNZ11_015128 [Volvox africanus]|uniref:Methyltransferase FkbM domain-containing protein n=1 Tax=Volvox africanus TaxID=51714 RepID=A0ABQ5SLV6_9CHLO|nr:hypothetical protein VaNZ11_015128 [Volvox africanus]
MAVIKKALLFVLLISFVVWALIWLHEYRVGTFKQCSVPSLPIHGRTKLNLHGLKNDTGPFDLASVLNAITYPETPFVARTKTDPDFWLAVYRFPNLTWEAHAGAIINYGGVWEPRETELAKTILKECTATSLVLDVGGFVGYYAMLSALMGCKVKVWEGHPTNAFMIQFSAALNSLTDYITVYNRVATDASTPMMFSGIHMDGHVADSYQNSDNPEFKKLITQQPESGYNVHPLGVDQAIPTGEVLLLLVDVEGYEPHVFRSARQLMSQRRVKYVILEYNMWRAMTVDEGVNMVMEFMSYGYRVFELPHGLCPYRRIRDREQILQISRELQNKTYSCTKWCISLLLTRDGLPNEITSKYHFEGVS